MTTSFDLWDWCAAVLRDPIVRADARVVMLSSDGGTEHARFRLRRCLPVRLKAPPLDSTRGVVAVEELELACESLTLEHPGDGAAPEPPRGPKAELRELDERLLKEVNQERWVEVQFNPRDLRRSLVNPAGEARLALELWFEAGGKDDVRRLTERVAYFATPRPADTRTPGTPPVRFAWGEFRFDGRVEAFEETLDFFSPDGRPRLALSLVGGA